MAAEAAYVRSGLRNASHTASDIRRPRGQELEDAVLNQRRGDRMRKICDVDRPAAGGLRPAEGCFSPVDRPKLILPPEPAMPLEDGDR